MRVSNFCGIGALAAGLLLMTGVAKNIQAAVIVNVFESGSDVVFETEAGGSLNLVGLTPDCVLPSCIGTTFAFIDTTGPSMSLGVTDEQDIEEYLGASGPAMYGTSVGILDATTGSGDRFGFRGSTNTYISVPIGYESGDPLSASNTFANTSFASLGLIPGSHVWSWSSDSITLNIAQVPVPAAVWLFGSALGLLGWIKRKAT